MPGATHPKPVSAPAVAPHASVVSGVPRNAARLSAMTAVNAKDTPKMTAGRPFCTSASVKPLACIQGR